MKKLIIAAVLAGATLAQADVTTITLGDSWSSDGDTAPAVINQSSTGFTMDRTQPGTVIDGNNRVFQSDADLTGSNGKTLAKDETLVWSFDVKADTIVAAADRDFRFSLWDQDNDGLSVRVDWGSAGGTFLQYGWANAQPGTGYIGAYDVDVTSTDAPTLDLGQTSAPVHFEVSIKKNNTTSINDVIIKIDDQTYSNTFTGVNAFNNVDLVGFRMADAQASGFTVSNMSMQIIPEPATLGLIVAMGVGLVGVRRLFMV
ncbi:hypothetical protein PDESU_04017 [Pontiella desulfatans]|uniref:PEP-CTERM protein-sorting domain-containing protein n=2 Tax=Pontiella desulfatans TaxID=2750659 RepID=A0A6C2U7M7_PONDE|nr:hypothetical protein PDESU_04017 [Pontiella desulfatans]